MTKFRNYKIEKVGNYYIAYRKDDTMVLLDRDYESLKELKQYLKDLGE